MPNGVVICELLVQTLSPDNDSINAAEHELAKYEREDTEFFKCLSQIISETSQDPARIHVGQAAAVCLKNALCREGTSSTAKHGIWEQIVPLLLSIPDRLIHRQLAECCKPLLEDASLAECFAQHLVRHFYQLASVDKDSTSRPLLALLRCLKVVVRVCVSTAAQPAFQTLSHAVGSLLPELCCLLRTCVMSHRLEEQKAVLKVLLVATSYQQTCGMVVPYIVFQQESATQWISSLASIIWEPPGTHQGANELVLMWKSKARAMQIWTFITQHVLDLTEVSSMVDFMDYFIDTYVKVLASGMEQLDEPTVQSLGEDDDVGRAFQTFAVQIFTCLSCDAVWRPDMRRKYLDANTERLLTTTLLRFLFITAKDIELFDTNPDEYTMRSHEDFSNSLSCPHGCESALDCHACNLRRVHHEYIPSTPRAAAMIALRELVNVGDGRVKFLSFLHKQLNSLAVPSASNHAVAVHCGLIKAFAAAADLVVSMPQNARSSEGAISVDSEDIALDATMTDTQTTSSVTIDPITAPIVLSVITTCLLPAVFTPDGAVPLAAHLRCVVSVVLERFLGFLAELGEVQHALGALQGIVTLLIDPHTTVRRQALDAFRNAIQSRPLLKPLLHDVAPEVLSALIALLHHGDAHAQTETLSALTFMLYEFRDRLGDVGTRTHSSTINAADMERSKIAAHGNLLAHLIEQYFDLQSKVPTDVTQARLVAMDGDENAERMLPRYIEAVHAVALSAPKSERDGTLHADLVPQVVGFLASIFTPSMMQLAAKHNVDIDAIDMIDVLPLADDAVVMHVFHPMVALLTDVPRMSDVLVLPICKFLFTCGPTLLRNEPLARQLCDIARHGLVHSVTLGRGAANLLCSMVLATAIDPASRVVVPENRHAHDAPCGRRLRTHCTAILVQALVENADAAVPIHGASADGSTAGSPHPRRTMDQRPHDVRTQLLSRLVYGTCVMLYVDPETTFTQLSAPGPSERGGRGGVDVLMSLGLAAGFPSLLRVPGVDKNLSLLGLANLLYWNLCNEQRMINTAIIARLIQGCFALATPLHRSGGSESQQHDSAHAAGGARVDSATSTLFENADGSVGGPGGLEEDMLSVGSDESEGDSPEMEAFVSDRGHKLLIEVVTHMCRLDAGKERELRGLVGHDQWHALFGTTGEADIAHVVSSK